MLMDPSSSFSQLIINYTWYIIELHRRYFHLKKNPFSICFLLLCSIAVKFAKWHNINPSIHFQLASLHIIKRQSRKNLPIKMMVRLIDFLNWSGCTKNSWFSKLETAKKMAKFGTTHKKFNGWINFQLECAHQWKWKWNLQWIERKYINLKANFAAFTGLIGLRRPRRAVHYAL